MGEKSKREGISVCVWLTHFAVQWKLTQQCKATILQKKLIKINKYYVILKKKRIEMARGRLVFADMRQEIKLTQIPEIVLGFIIIIFKD